MSHSIYNITYSNFHLSQALVETLIASHLLTKIRLQARWKNRTSLSGPLHRARHRLVV